MADAARFTQVVHAIEQAQLAQRTAPQVAAQSWNTPYMPFPLEDFAKLLFAAAPLIPDDRPFLDVGAGPGPMMIIARDVFGLDVAGIEILDPLAQAGRDAGLPVETADALTYDGYGKAGCIWFNRTIRDRDLQRKLEAKVWDETAPGTVVICAHLETRPPKSWIIVDDSWADLRYGAWVKPFPVPEL